MRTLWIRLLFLLVLLPVSAALAQAPSGHTLDYDGQERAYTLYVPPGVGEDTPAPLVIALHSIMSSGPGMMALTGLNALADEAGFVVAYPDAYQYVWADGRDTAGMYPQRDASDDVGFLRAVVTDIAAQVNIAPDQVYLTGMGNGGVMAYRVACESPETFAGVAVVAAFMWDYQEQPCAASPAAPLDVLIVHGSNDTYYPEEGRSLEIDDAGNTLQVWGLEQTLDFWRTRNICEDTPTGTGNIQEYTCDSGSRLALFTVEGGGSNWPRPGHSLNQYGVDTTRTIWRFFAGDSDWAQQSETLTSHPDDIPRSYILYVPHSYDPSVPTPLVVALHGRPGNGAGFALITELNPVAEANGFVVVYPDGVGQQWDYYNDILPIASKSIDDVAFLRTLVADLSLDLNIDPARLYVTGFSNGGMMTERMACETSDLFAAFAPVGGTMPIDFGAICRDAPVTPIILIHGTADVSIPWNGLVQQIGGRTYNVLLSVPDTINFWAIHNGCGIEGYSFEDLPQNDPRTAVRHHTFTDCTDGADVEVYSIAGGGHNWPGVDNDSIGPQIAGTINTDINAGEAIWAFFAAHPKTTAPE
ncbi:MAG: prolyl oligopeptidase family serine peptidase [Anaerolineaceae bacterium]|nr:prolyl oligopeptidase family serine peptidase [Anaerolineaceae bacterium]